MFCMDVRTIMEYFRTEHQMTDFYNRAGVNLLHDKKTDFLKVIQFNFRIKEVKGLNL